MSEPSQPDRPDGVITAIVGLADFERAFKTNFAAVHRFLVRRVGVPLADDLAAETFATGFRRRQSFDPELGSLRAWLFGIANNLLRNHWRAEQRLLELSSRLNAQPEPPSQTVEPDDRLAAEALAPLMAEALAALPTEQRDVVLLYAWADLAPEEIATALHIAQGTARSRLWRAREALGAHLKRSGVLPPDQEMGSLPQAAGATETPIGRS